MKSALAKKEFIPKQKRTTSEYLFQFFNIIQTTKEFLFREEMESIYTFKIDLQNTDLNNDFQNFLNHSFNVMLENYSFIKYLNDKKNYSFTTEYLNSISLGGFVHDIGKLESSIFNLIFKNGNLSDNNYEHIKKHTITGYLFIKECMKNRFIKKRDPIIKEQLQDIITQHHLYSQKGDFSIGGGYFIPRNYKKKTLAIGSQITRISDIYLALIEKRPYGEVFTEKEALKKMKLINYKKPFNTILFKHFLDYQKQASFFIS